MVSLVTFVFLQRLIKPQGGAFDLAASVLTAGTVALRRYIGSAFTIVCTEHFVMISSVMRMIMPRCAATNAVGKSVLKAIRVTLNVGNPVETVNGRLPKWNYRVATVKITSRGMLGWSRQAFIPLTLLLAICQPDLMKYIAPLWSLVRFPTASIQPVWLVRPTPVKSVVHKFVTPQGPAAPNGALRDAGNARSSPKVPSCP